MQEKVNELFPYPSFNVRLDLKKEKKICWFKDSVDLNKYLIRHKINKKTADIRYNEET